MPGNAPLYWMDVWYLVGGGNAAQAARLADSLGASENLNAEQLELLAWFFKDHMGETRAPMRWINESLRKRTTADRLNTKAYLRLLAHQPKEAEEIARLAVKQAKADGEDLTLHEALLQEIRK
ncbi:MAG: hypothetical protein KF690_09730 [Bacteroidetes bacterium]|nr:hypothetical protein [Bacteroidota bacterium]